MRPALVALPCALAVLLGLVIAANVADTPDRPTSPPVVDWTPSTPPTLRPMPTFTVTAPPKPAVTRTVTRTVTVTETRPAPPQTPRGGRHGV